MRVRSSRTSCSRTRSTARRRRRSPRCSRRWRSGRSRSTAAPCRCPTPFMVAATMNPIEYEGTYTLPEAQLDRFLLKLVLDLPPRDTEFEVLRRHARGFDPRDLDGGRCHRRARPRRAGRGAEARLGRRRIGRCARLRRRPRPRDPPLAVGQARRLAARHDRAARGVEGVGLAARLRQRDAGPHPGDGAARCSVTGSLSVPRPSSRACPSMRSCARSSPRSASRSDPMPVISLHIGQHRLPARSGDRTPPADEDDARIPRGSGRFPQFSPLLLIRDARLADGGHRQVRALRAHRHRARARVRGAVRRGRAAALVAGSWSASCSASST